ncbi:MAG: signal recognition particle protein [Actinobacteria bacterium]|nr:MAG: signal recognition particle protein [Actinomycetota bacterium]REK40368.1 MAG: signal recognition particle protein [Actinomycetota bacterium]
MFDTLTQRLESTFAALRGKGRLSEKDIDAALRDVRLALLEADVNVGVVKAFLARVKERALGEDVKKSLTPGQQVIKIVNEELVATLGSEPAELVKAAPPLTILMVGLQGSGKTTTAGKLALHLKNKGKKPLLVAADLQRPAAIDQLETLAGRVDVPVVVDRKGKPAKLVKTAMKEASRMGRDVVIVDTAGRLQIDDQLMKELGDVSKAADPDEVLLVVDAMTGQDAVNVATGFQQQIGITGIVLSKLDGDARGGAAISVREVTGAPVKFAGVGESLGDLEPFYPDRMASRILGMGDVMSLIEKAESTFDEKEAEKAARKLEKGDFNLEDFLSQFQQMKRMGPLKDILAMLPGSGSLLREVDVDDREIRRVEAIIQSMTPEERRNPKIIGGSRKRRIASGSGMKPQDVNRLLKQFADAKKMMKQLAGGRGMPNLDALMGGQRTKR